MLESPLDSVTIDFNSRSPRKASPNMYRVVGVSRLTNNIFEVENDEMRVGAKAVLVPGVAAGLCLAHELYGKLPREQVIQPAIELAVEGFEANWDQTLYLANIMHRMQAVPALATMWLPKGRPPRSFPQPDRVVQPHLGKLLKRIASEGPEVMYRGRSLTLLWNGYKNAEEL